jgi:hypothetical protein
LAWVREETPASMADSSLQVIPYAGRIPLKIFIGNGVFNFRRQY